MKNPIKMDKIIIFGGSGFIGKHLVKELQNNYNVIVISRRKRTIANQFNNKVTVERLRSRDITKLVELIDGAKGVINLAGENVGGRWSNNKMEKIKKSRLDIDSIIARVIIGAKNKPEVVIQGSAIGIYGFTRNTIDVTEETPLGKRGFLPKVALSHEESLQQIESLTRVVYIRTGLVLDANEGALPKIANLFKYNIGGKFGSGKQWNSWIHIQDEVRAIKHLLENTKSSGPYNLTAPNPVQNDEFSRSIGKALKKPSFMPAPSFIIRLLTGKMGNELLLSGLKVIPSKLESEGFKFNFENIDDALANIYNH